MNSAIATTGSAEAAAEHRLRHPDRHRCRHRPPGRKQPGERQGGARRACLRRGRGVQRGGGGERRGADRPTGGYTSPVATGAVVAQAYAGLPATAVGLQAGDVIVSFDGSKVASPNDFERLIGLTRPYRSAQIGWVDLGGTHHTATVTLAIVPVR